MLTPTPMPSLLRVKAKDPRMLPKTEKTSPPRGERKVASPSGTESGPMMPPMKRTARSPGAPGKANGAAKEKARKVEKEKARVAKEAKAKAPREERVRSPPPRRRLKPESSTSSFLSYNE